MMTVEQKRGAVLSAPVSDYRRETGALGAFDAQGDAHAAADA